MGAQAGSLVDLAMHTPDVDVCAKQPLSGPGKKKNEKSEKRKGGGEE